MKVLVVQESAEIIDPLSAVFKLRWPACSIVATTDGAKAVELAESESPDVVILGIDLPDIDGFEVLRHIRQFSEVPTVILTPRSEEMDIIRGLETGADDYVVQPFSSLEFLARVRAAMRRSGWDGLEENTPPVVTGDLTVNLQSREVTLRGESVHLTATEYQILYYLVRSQGRWLDHGSLEQWIWGQRGAVDSSVIRRYIHQLRRKLDDVPPRIIVNQPGKGYRFNLVRKKEPAL